jgi:hypothetical protein
MVLTPQRPRVEVVKIGVVYPLTGSLAPIGQDQVNAIKLVFDEVNAKGGIKSLGGAKLEIVLGDTKGDPRVGADETERLITVEKVALVMGAYQSAVTETASAVAERYGIPFVNPDSSSPLLTERGLKWFFRVTPHDGILVTGMLEFLRIRGLGILRNTEIGRVPPERVVELAKQAYVPGSDALFISCTNLKTFTVIGRLESELGKPVVTSNQASLWAALRALGTDVRLGGLGKLLEDL